MILPRLRPMAFRIRTIGHKLSSFRGIHTPSPPPPPPPPFTPPKPPQPQFFDFIERFFRNNRSSHLHESPTGIYRVGKMLYYGSVIMGIVIVATYAQQVYAIKIKEGRAADLRKTILELKEEEELLLKQLKEQEGSR